MSTEPIDEATQAAIDSARLRTAAADALTSVGIDPNYTELFIPTMAERLRLDDAGHVEVLDDGGAPLRGANPVRLALEIRAESEKRSGKGRFFR